MEDDPTPPPALAILARRIRTTGIVQLIAVLAVLVGSPATEFLPTWFLVLAMAPLVLQAVPMIRAGDALRRFTEGDRDALEPALDKLGRSLGFEIWVASMMWRPLALTVSFIGITWTVLRW